MLLAHIFIAEHKALNDLNIPINGNFQCGFSDGVLNVVQKSNSTKYYDGFHCSALIGPNGVGKSSILEVLELLTARTDSRALVVFYDEQAKSYFICGVNMDEGDVKTVEADFPHIFVVNNDWFLSRYEVNLVKVNNLPADDGLLTLSSRKPGRYVKELTVRENVKSNRRRKRYFEKLLDYYTAGQSRDDFMEEVAFAFTFSSSPVSILQGAMNRSSFNDKQQVDTTQDWYRKIKTPIEFVGGVEVEQVFQALLELSALSILSALATDSGVSKKLILSYMLAQYYRVGLQGNEGISNSSRLQTMLQSLRSKDLLVFISNEADMSLEEVSRAVRQAESSLAAYLGVFKLIAETICDFYFDGNSLDLSRITTADYFAIEALTGLIGSLPDNIAANMKWGWRGVSTGELARAHIFAEIYAFLKKAGRSNNIIVIDEADLYLHPEWQRTFLHDLLHHLSDMRIHENILNPQIIICTHSPIIISDFLPDNIVSLRKDKNGRTEVTKSFGFGNAIGDIYMDGMHLKSTFGEHAKKTLDNLIIKGRQGILSSDDERLIEKIPNNHVRNFLRSHD